MEKFLSEIAQDQYLIKIDDYMQSAWIGHAPFLKFLLRELKPSLFVELGVHNGFSYFVACQSIRECALSTKAFGIDHWDGDFQAGFFDNSVYESVVSINTKYETFSTLIKKPFQDSLIDFQDSSIDLLHIDGFHSYESVKNDFESWFPKMTNDGVVLFHDIHVRRESFGVFKYWTELKTRFKTIEFVGSHGLGVLFLGNVPTGGLRELLEISNSGFLSQIQGTFGSISDDVLQESGQRIYERTLEEKNQAVAKLESISNSTIWKITKPYRWVRKFH